VRRVSAKKVLESPLDVSQKMFDLWDRQQPPSKESRSIDAVGGAPASLTSMGDACPTHGSIPAEKLFGNQVGQVQYPDLKAVIFQLSYRFGI
jgi:hypothetical protein